jgi:hypothetical protein
LEAVSGKLISFLQEVRVVAFVKSSLTMWIGNYYLGCVYFGTNINVYDDITPWYLTIDDDPTLNFLATQLGYYTFYFI